jgi:hypothetical protein
MSRRSRASGPRARARRKRSASARRSAANRPRGSARGRCSARVALPRAVAEVGAIGRAKQRVCRARSDAGGGSHCFVPPTFTGGMGMGSPPLRNELPRGGNFFQLCGNFSVKVTRHAVILAGRGSRPRRSRPAKRLISRGSRPLAYTMLISRSDTRRTGRFSCSKPRLGDTRSRSRSRSCSFAPRVAAKARTAPEALGAPRPRRP